MISMMNSKRHSKNETKNPSSADFVVETSRISSPNRTHKVTIAITIATPFPSTIPCSLFRITSEFEVCRLSKGTTLFLFIYKFDCFI